MTLELLPIAWEREVVEGDDLAAFILESAPPLRAGNVLVISQKVVSKSEGRIVDLADIVPSSEALDRAADHSDPRFVEVVIRESRRVVRQRDALLIVETRHGLVCANAGVDRSNAPRPGTVVLLPVDPDASAQRLRALLSERTGAAPLGVVIADTMGRAWREGIVGTAIGVSGVAALRDLTGFVDGNGYRLQTTAIAIADELAAAADLVLGKVERVPCVLVRGLELPGDGTAGDLIRSAERDLFR